MRSEGFSFNAGGLEVGVVFAQGCFGGRKCSQPSATVRSTTAMRSLSLTIGRRSQNVTLAVDIPAHSVLLLHFVTWVEVACAFCVAGAML